jgi:hypothetical protein
MSKRPTLKKLLSLLVLSFGAMHLIASAASRHSREPWKRDEDGSEALESTIDSMRFSLSLLLLAWLIARLP